MEPHPPLKYRTYSFHRDLHGGEQLSLLNGVTRRFPLEGWIFRYQVHERTAFLRGVSVPASRIELEFLEQGSEYPILRLSFTDGGPWIKPDWELSAVCEGVNAISSTAAAVSLANRLLDGVFRAGALASKP